LLLGVAIIGIIEDLVSLVIIAIGLTWVTAGLLAIALFL
jgi:hypothetical protein